MKKYVFVKVVFILFFLSSLGAQPYEWLLKPGMEKWKTLQTHEEMLEVLQIPDDMLKNMSTDDLLQTCLNYPLFPDIWAFNSFQTGIDKAMESFNGFRELQKHDLAAKKLLEEYKKINLDDLDKQESNIDKGKFKINICKIEVLLSLKIFLTRLNNYDKQVLIKSALEKNNIMLKSKQFSFYSIESNAFLMSKLLMLENFGLLYQKIKNNNNLNNFIKYGTGATKQTLSDITESSQLYLTENN